LLLVFVFLSGTFGFYIMGEGRWSLFDCAYMTSLTLTTVGYGEILPAFDTQGRVLAMILMWAGMAFVLYAISSITAFIVEQKLSRILRERKMEKRISALKNHLIVCGGGHTGFNVLRELTVSGHSCVYIEIKPERLEWISNQFEKQHFILGDATEEETLIRAGIKRASGILAVLGEDSYNLLITVQARYINPEIKIVARCNENNLTDKFYRAGANYVVNPSFIGGMRMASEMIRPHIVSFLDRMLRGNDPTIRVEEVTVMAQSPWVGRSLKEVDIHGLTGLVPISVKHLEESDFTYNPCLDEVLRPLTVIVVIGNHEQLSKLRKYCEGEHCTLP
jgi:voltage-gated potassium channel